jgi:hypothetical protein
MNSFDPGKLRELAERIEDVGGSAAAPLAAGEDLERSRGAERMLGLASELECLRELIAQAKRTHGSSAVAVEEGDWFEAVRTLSPQPARRLDPRADVGRRARPAVPAPRA